MMPVFLDESYLKYTQKLSKHLVMFNQKRNTELLKDNKILKELLFFNVYLRRKWVIGAPVRLTSLGRADFFDA